MDTKLLSASHENGFHIRLMDNGNHLEGEPNVSFWRET